MTWKTRERWRNRSHSLPLVRTVLGGEATEERGRRLERPLVVVVAAVRPAFRREVTLTAAPSAVMRLSLEIEEHAQRENHGIQMLIPVSSSCESWELARLATHTV